MSGSANVRSIQAIREFRAGTIQFQEDAQVAMNLIRQQLQRAQQWLEHECPQQWRMEVQRGFARVSEARGRLDACRRRRTGDFKPSCFEEQEAFRREKRRLEIAHQKVEVVRRWAGQYRQEIDEYKGRSGQMDTLLATDIPKLIALLDRIGQTLESYAEMSAAPTETAAPTEVSPSVTSAHDTGGRDSVNTTDDESVPATPEKAETDAQDR